MPTTKASFVIGQCKRSRNYGLERSDRFIPPGITCCADYDALATSQEATTFYACSIYDAAALRFLKKLDAPGRLYEGQSVANLKLLSVAALHFSLTPPPRPQDPRNPPQTSWAAPSGADPEPRFPLQLKQRCPGQSPGQRSSAPRPLGRSDWMQNWLTSWLGRCGAL